MRFFHIKKNQFIQSSRVYDQHASSANPSSSRYHRQGNAPGKKNRLNNVPLCMYEAFAVITFDVGGIFAKIFILVLANRIKGRRRIRMPSASGGKFSRAQKNRKENAKLTDIAVIIWSL